MLTFNSERRATLARGLKAARRKAGLSVKEVTNILAVKGLQCRHGTLSAWERHSDSSREPFASYLPILATIYDCSVDDFFTEPSGSCADQEER